MTVQWQRLRDLVDGAMERHHLTVRGLAAAAGVSHGTINQLRNRQAVPSPRTCQKLAPWLNVTEDVLLELAGHKSDQSMPQRIRSRDEIFAELQAVDATEVPIYDITGSASPSRLFVGDGPIEYAYLPERRRYARGRIKGLTIRGSCLSPLVQDGDQVFIDTQADWEDGDIVLAVVDDALHLKQLQSSPSGWVLAPKNGETALIVDEAVVVLGKYIGLWRPGLR